MSFISEKVGPFFEAFSRAIEGEYVTNELQYKGGKEAGMDFSSKIERASRRYIRDRYFFGKAVMILPCRHLKSLLISTSSRIMLLVFSAIVLVV